MSDLDFPIHTWRQCRAQASEDLRVLAVGPRWSRNGEDVTKSETAKAMQIVKQMDILIADYEANRPYLKASATADDLADALALALRFDGRKREHDAAEIMAASVAKRLVEHLERSGFVVMKRPPIGGSAPAYRGAAAT